MHLCVWLCVCTFTCIHLKAQRPGNMRGSSSVVLPTVFWGQICCWIWNLSIPASLAVQFAVRSLFLPPRCWDEECWGFEPWSFCFHSKYCVHWAIWWPLGKDLKTPSNQSFFFFFFINPPLFFLTWKRGLGAEQYVYHGGVQVPNSEVLENPKTLSAKMMTQVENSTRNLASFTKLLYS